jgi:myo-inositol-hexaphosphate 3-phosphohydrolase
MQTTGLGRAVIVALAWVTSAAWAQVSAIAQTAPLPGGPTARTQVMIWLHPTSAANSVVFASDDLVGGLWAYDVLGQTLGQPLTEQVYGVDLKQGVALKGVSTDLMAVSSATGLRFYSVGGDGGLSTVVATGLTPGIVSAAALMRPFGVSPMTLWLGNDTGGITQYELDEIVAGQLTATLTGTYAFPGNITGLTADDATGRLYVSSSAGVFYLESGARSVAGFPDAGVVDDQIAGPRVLSLFRRADGRVLILVPNTDLVTVYGPTEPFAAVNSFRVDGDAGAGAAQRTPLAAVMPAAIPGHFEGGLLVAFDTASSRFKLADWGQVAAARGLDLNVTFDPRKTPVILDAGLPSNDGGTGGGAGGGTGTGGGGGSSTIPPTGGSGGRPPLGGGEVMPAPGCMGCSSAPLGLSLVLTLAAFSLWRGRRRY